MFISRLEKLSNEGLSSLLELGRTTNRKMTIDAINQLLEEGVIDEIDLLTVESGE